MKLFFAPAVTHDELGQVTQSVRALAEQSKTAADKRPLESLDFSIGDCLGDAIQTLGLRAHQKGLELVEHISPEVPDVLIGDPFRLRQVLMNLVGNSMQFTEEGEVVVRVRVESRGTEDVLLHFTVTDTGIGIPADKLQLIFHPFEQADGSTTCKFGGTGMGLTISSQLVDLMGGRLWVESEPGRGSTFHFTLRFPLSAKPSARAVHQPSASLRERPGLIVGDNTMNNDLRKERTLGMSSTSKLVVSKTRRMDVFDHGEMRNRLGDDLELVTELIELFLEESPKLLVDVQIAVQRRDAKAIERTAHRLKGSAGKFGINATVKTAMRLEVLGRTGDLADVDAICQSLCEELRLLQDELDQWSEAETTAVLS